MRIRHLVAAVLLLLALSGVAIAAPGVPVELQKGNEIYYLRDHMQMLEDRTGKLTINEVARERNFEPFGTMDNANAYYWIRFTITAREASADSWYLFMGYKPRLVDFYAPQPDGTYTVQHSGNALPYRDRPVKVYGWVAFALPVATKPQTYFARIQTVEPNLTVAVDSSDFFFHQNQQQLLMIVGLTSVLVALALSSMILFGLARGRVYLYYAAYLIAQLFYRANDVGVASAYLWPGSSMSWTQLDVFFDGLTVVTATLFVRAFLHTAHLSRVLDRINIGIAVVAGCYAIAGLLNVPFKISWAWNFGYIYVPVWIISGILAWRAGEEQAKFFLLAWIALMAGILAADIKQLGVGRGNFLAEFVLSHGPYFGIAIQSTFLSLALAIELRQLSTAKARFESMAVTDTVTEIANRRVFDDRLRSEWNRALRNGKPLAILIADVDFFKPFNDQYGHAAGDHCLRAIAKSGASCMNRPGDTFCRFGGEEFAAVLPETDREGALAIAESIRNAILLMNIGHERSSAGVVTVSVGVASAVPTSQNSAAGVVNAADNALYRAKANGRNRVVTENYESVGNVLSMV
ncbi:MAG: diguanylate cyclase [Candidatus Eremiobacteraeota bacterium]|nr:diguanylate cyclase [Candidatus Eremiobacteraeota bacterium]